VAYGTFHAPLCKQVVSEVITCCRRSTGCRLSTAILVWLKRTDFSWMLRKRS